MKTYIGIRDRGGVRVIVQENGRPRPLRHIARHSPTGFAWGYGGSGPADLALSILADAVGLTVADEWYQRFKWEYVAAWPWSGWRITEGEVQSLARYWQSQGQPAWGVTAR